MRPLYFLSLPILAAGLAAGGTALLAQNTATAPSAALSVPGAAAVPAASAGTDLAAPPPTSGAVLDTDLSGAVRMDAPADPVPVARDDLPLHAKDNSIDSAGSAAPADPSAPGAQPAPEGALNALPTFTPAGQNPATTEPGEKDAIPAAAAPLAPAADPDAPAPISIRGAAPDVAVPLPEVYHTREGRQTRAYRQQPPIIPHAIDKYQIDLNANQCLACHDWTNAGERGAPTLSMTHYLDRQGQQLDSVAGTRWFCNQCHVPQADAPPLVANTFRPSATR